MSGKSILVLVFALACGLLAMWGVRDLIAKNKAPIESVDVLVAARDLKAEEIIKPEMLALQKLPKNIVPADAFTKIEEVEGRWLSKDVDAGEPVRSTKFGPKGTPPSLVSRIPPGMRALTLEVNEQAGVAGFIFPEHHVDIILAQNSREAQGQDGETILEDVLVLAAGQATTRPEDKSIQVRSVTIAVRPEDVERIAGARAKGPLVLSLRGLGDTEKKKPAKTNELPALAKIVAAKNDIAPGKNIQPDDVALVDWPRDRLPAGTIDSLEAVVGKTAKTPLVANDLVLLSRLGTPEPPPQKTKEHTVFLATRPIPRGVPIKPFLVRSETRPESELPPNSVSNWDALIGTWAACSIPAGKPILASDLRTESPWGASANGYRTITIKATTEHAFDGELHGQTFVDLYAQTPRENTPTPTQSNPLAILLPSAATGANVLAQPTGQELAADLVAECVFVLNCYPIVDAAANPEPGAEQAAGDHHHYYITLLARADDAHMIMERRTAEFSFTIRQHGDRGGFVTREGRNGAIYHGFRSRPEPFRLQPTYRLYDPEKHRDKYDFLDKPQDPTPNPNSPTTDSGQLVGGFQK